MSKINGLSLKNKKLAYQSGSALEKLFKGCIMNNDLPTANSQCDTAYRNLLQNLPGMVYRCANRLDYRMEFVSEGCEELTGYSPEELINSHAVSYGDLIHPEDQTTVWSTIQEAIKQLRPFIMEYRIYNKNGNLRWVWEKGRAIVTDKTNGVLDGFILDITDRKEAEEAKEKAYQQLQESEAKFRLLTELAPVGIVIADNNQRVLYVNGLFTELFGYTITDMPSVKEWWQLAYPDPVICERVRKDWVSKIESAEKEQHHIFSYEAEVTCKNGTVRKIDFRAAMNGNFYFVIFNDITERGRLEKRLRMIHKMESVGRLAGGIAHDFNNMLGIIIGYAEMLREKYQSDDELVEALSEILSAGKKSREMTRKLLSFARRQHIKPLSVELNQFIEQMLPTLRQVIGENVELIWQPQQDIWQISIDATQLDQLLINLCLNAREAIDSNGRIIVETANIVLDREYCCEHQGFVAGEYVMLAIGDNGRGIERELLDHIFEPFFTTKNNSVSVGMGLPTVYGIVKQNSGFINIYSEPGHGTSVKIYLPHLQHENDTKLPIKKNLIKGNAETVLLVEDEPALLKMTRMMLKRLGYQVIEAGNPLKAIEIAEKLDGGIDLLITDIVMPGMDGNELAIRIKKLFPDVMTLFISGYTANIITHNDILADTTSFLPKPFSINDLSQTIHNMLSSRQDVPSD